MKEPIREPRKIISVCLKLETLQKKKWPTEPSIKIFMKRRSSKRLIITNAVLNLCTHSIRRKKRSEAREVPDFQAKQGLQGSEVRREIKSLIILLARQ